MPWRRSFLRIEASAPRKTKGHYPAGRLSLIKSGNLAADLENVFFGASQVKAGNTRISGKFIGIDTLAGKANNHYFKEITVKVLEDLQAIIILKAKYGFVAVSDLTDLKAGQALVQGG
jgi:hypothetical protein